MDPSAFYRLPDTTFLALIAASVGFCLVHAARHAARRAMRSGRDTTRRDAPSVAGDTPRSAAGRTASPVPESEAARLDDPVAVARGVPRHSAFQRFVHWANASAVAVLVVSGLAIYGVPSPGVPRHTTAFWFSWHVWLAPAFAALVIAHVVRELLTPGHVEAMWPGGPRPGKYDLPQVFFHSAVALNLTALVLTGAVLWKPLRALLPLRLLALGWEFVFLNRIAHGLFTATLLALVLAHLYFALLVGENRSRLRSMALGSRGER